GAGDAGGVPRPWKRPGPVDRARACLEADQAWRQLRHKRAKLSAPEPPLQDHAPLHINAVELEHVFRQVDAQYRHLHDSLLRSRCQAMPLATREREPSIPFGGAESTAASASIRPGSSTP